MIHRVVEKKPLRVNIITLPHRRKRFKHRLLLRACICGKRGLSGKLMKKSRIYSVSTC